MNTCLLKKEGLNRKLINMSSQKSVTTPPAIKITQYLVIAGVADSCDGTLKLMSTPMFILIEFLQVCCYGIIKYTDGDKHYIIYMHALDICFYEVSKYP